LYSAGPFQRGPSPNRVIRKATPTEMVVRFVITFRSVPPRVIFSPLSPKSSSQELFRIPSYFFICSLCEVSSKNLCLLALLLFYPPWSPNRAILPPPFFSFFISNKLLLGVFGLPSSPSSLNFSFLVSTILFLLAFFCFHLPPVRCSRGVLSVTFPLSQTFVLTPPPWPTPNCGKVPEL